MVSRPQEIEPTVEVTSLLQTDEAGHSGFLSPLPGDDSEAVFLLSVAAAGSTRRCSISGCRT